MADILDNLEINHDFIDYVSDEANNQLELIFSSLNIEMPTAWSSKEIRSACPIHGGNNPTAFSYNTQTKRWVCYTKQCHEGYNSLLGFIRLRLEQVYNKEFSFKETVDWVCSLLKLQSGKILINLSEDEKYINKIIEQYKFKNYSAGKGTTNEFFKPFSVDLLKDIQPSQYFLDQGFSDATLRKYNVGFCSDKTKPMYMRSYAPVLDDDAKMVIGVTGRTINEKCPYCPLYHQQGNGCPHENPQVRGYPKWKHFGFNSCTTLYNSWFAKEYIKKSKTVIVVEGPKDVWWLDQHGVHNAVGILGLKIHKDHIKKLIGLETINLISALDNDKYGNLGNDKLYEALGSYFKVYSAIDLMPKGKDIADLTADEINSKVLPFIRQIEYV